MKIGHTAITWGIPGDVETAYRETAELGYLGFETFAQTIIEWNERPGGYRALVQRYGIPTGAAYCYKQWIEPATSERDPDAARREADAAREVGASAFVLQAGSRSERGYGPDEMSRLAEALNGIGSYCQEIGLVAALHPHTRTAIENRADIDAILQLTDPDLVGFAPDIGQIAKGGSEIVEVLNTYHDRIAHVHLKDWCGRYERDAAGREIDATGYASYEPIGNGVLPMSEILQILRGSGKDIWVNVELDRTDQAPRSPKEAAAMSRRYLGEILGDQVTWRP